MNKEKRMPGIVLGNYVLFTTLTGLGGYLFVTYPHNEALGGIILGLTGVVLGVIIPFHVWRVRLVKFNLLPLKKEAWKVVLSTLLFTAILVFVYPSGILGNKATMKVLEHPPALIPALVTFLFLLFSAIIYTFLFWGGILHAFQAKYGTITAILVTSFLFSLYHVAEFAFTPLTPKFFILMFISGLMCTGFTIISKSVLPTLIAQQFGQFMHFISLEDNPFTDPAGLLSNTMLLLFCLGIYGVIRRKKNLTRILPCSSNK